jgi:exopolyphosphatase
VDSIYKTALKTPIVSVPRADLPLRRETVLLLQLANVNVDKLHYIDDPNVLDGVKSVTLVDHNRLAVGMNAQVMEIVDHHYDEYSHENVQGESRTIAFQGDKALVASTCTLVAERLFASNAKPPYASDLSVALLGVILLDSVNMKPEAHKGTARDQAAIDTLVQDTDWSTLKGGGLLREDGVIDTDKLFERLSESKFDVDFWNELNVNDALRLDYKRFEAPTGGVFGDSSILLDIDSFLSKDSLVKEIELYMKQTGIQLLVVLSNRLINNAPRRELLLCGGDEKIVNDMATFLLTSPAANMMEMEEKNVEIETGPLTLRRFKQHNPKASRKQVAPIMLSFYTSTRSSSEEESKL